MMEKEVPYILAFSILLVFIWKSFINNIWKYSRRLPYPPGPKPLPIIGNLYDVPADPQWIGYHHLSQKYGERESLIAVLF